MANIVFCEQLAALPERIQQSLEASGLAPLTFRVALRTAYQPNSTIPRLWLLIFDEYLILASTHSTRGIWKAFPRHLVDSLKLEQRAQTQYMLHLREKDPASRALSLPVARDATDEHVERFRQLAAVYLL